MIHVCIYIKNKKYRKFQKLRILLQNLKNINKIKGVEFLFLAFNNGVGVNDNGNCQAPKIEYRGMEQSGSSSGS